MPPICTYLGKLLERIRTGFNAYVFAFFTLHVIEVGQTLWVHPETWTALHLTTSVVIFAKIIDFLKG